MNQFQVTDTWEYAANNDKIIYDILHMSEDIYKGLYEYDAKRRHDLTC